MGIVCWVMVDMMPTWRHHGLVDAAIHMLVFGVKSIAYWLCCLVLYMIGLTFGLCTCDFYVIQIVTFFEVFSSDDVCDLKHEECNMNTFFMQGKDERKLMPVVTNYTKKEIGVQVWIKHRWWGMFVHRLSGCYPTDDRTVHAYASAGVGPDGVPRAGGLACTRSLCVCVNVRTRSTSVLYRYTRAPVIRRT